MTLEVYARLTECNNFVKIFLETNGAKDMFKRDAIRFKFKD